MSYADGIENPTNQAPALEPHGAVHERRGFARAHIVSSISMNSPSNFYTGFTQDISEGGVFVVSYLTEPVGTRVTLELALPGGFELHAAGVVRWVREPRDLAADGEPPGMGIEFLALDDASRELVREFVDNRAPLFYAE